MKDLRKLGGRFCAAVLMIMALLTFGSAASATDISIAVMDMQKVVLACDAGKKGRQVVEKKAKELHSTFKKDEASLIALQREIEKKSSAWSDEKRQEEAIKFQKMRRDLKAKQDDAKLEMKRLQDKQLGPIIKKLEKIVTDVAKKKGCAIILPKNGVVYAAEHVDISDEVIKALNASMKK